MNLDDYEYNFIDEIYHYEGLWQRPSTCGLKIVKKGDEVLVVATDLYKENPGGSITEFVAELATLIANDFGLDMQKMTFIHHIPEVKSSLEFYAEAFYIVKFDVVDGEFQNPDWEKIDREKVTEMLNA